LWDLWVDVKGIVKGFRFGGDCWLMLEGISDLTVSVFGETGGEVRLAMVMVVDGGGKDGRGGDEGEGAVGGRQEVEMVDMHGYGNAVGRRISCGCVYTLSPLRISTPISPTPIPGVGSSRRGIRVHGPRLKHLYDTYRRCLQFSAEAGRS
jgi:hypothetical protein